MKRTTPAALHYRVDASQANAHLFQVTLTIAQPAAQQIVSLPVWIPGSYLVREFAKHLQKLEARQNGRRIAVQQLDKCRWQVASQAGQPLELRCEVYAFDNSVRTAWLDEQRGFFNGTSLCLRVHGQEEQPHHLELLAPEFAAGAAWRAATALTPVKVNRRGFGLYRAASYDELVDHPVELGDFWQGEFEACGITHQWVVAGATPAFDSARLLRDSQQICETVIRFWHPDIDQNPQAAPMQRYVFMLNAVDDSYGGLEHRASTALICGRRDLPRLGEARSSEGYTTLLGLISHEYFHTWNVKRLRPAELARYDYSQENYTELLWFFEGFTSYYDDLLLRRAGLLDDAGYLKLLNKTLNQVLQTPGREVQSVAQASYDAWVKYYRQDENTANATVSYYTKGSLVALALDLSLRQQGRSLDEAMRAVWQRCQGGPMSEADFASVLQALSGRSWGPELQAWVHSTRELPLQALLQHHGVAWHDDPAQLAQRLGLRVAEKNGSVQIKTVLRGGAAEKAGLAANDEWLGIEVGAQGWRLGKLDDLVFYAGQAKRVTALVARDQRLLRLPLTLPAASTTTTVRLAIAQADAVSAWLKAPPGAPQPDAAATAAATQAEASRSGSAAQQAPTAPPAAPKAPAKAVRQPRQRPLKTGARLVKKASTPSK